MRRKLAIEVQQVKSNSVGLVLKSVLYRLQSAHAHGLQLQKVGGGGSYNPTYKNVIRPAQLGRGPYSVQNDPPRHGARPPASFN